MQERVQCHLIIFFFIAEKSSSDSNKKCGGKSKRVRTIFTPEQLERLEAEFERQQYMVGPERLYLAHTLQLTEAQVRANKKLIEKMQEKKNCSTHFLSKKIKKGN